MNEPRGDSWQLNAVRHSDVAAPEQQQRQHTNYNRVRVRVVGTVGAGIGFMMNIKQCSGKSERTESWKGSFRYYLPSPSLVTLPVSSDTCWCRLSRGLFIVDSVF